MRIGIDARILGHPKSGIAVYVINLIEQFLRHKDLEIVLFADRPIYKEYLDTTNRVKTVVFGQQHRKRWSQFYLPGELKKYRIDIYHATWNNALPIFTRVPGILTVHDLIPLVVGGYFEKLSRKFKYMLSMRSAVKKAKIIITDAESTKNDLIKYFRVPEDKIRPIHLGITPPAARNSPIDKKAVLDKFGINRDCIVNIGSYDKRRNADSLIRAFAEFIRTSGADCQLVLIGGYDNFKKEVNRLKEIADKLNVADKVIFTNYVSEKQMQVLLSNAKMMVHLSLYEGFCLPVLEAMCAGVPVVASNRGSVPEIAGGAAIFVDPADEVSTARAIKSLWQDNNIRQDYIKKGAARIKEFSWEKTAEDIASIYREVLGGKIF